MSTRAHDDRTDARGFGASDGRPGMRWYVGRRGCSQVGIVCPIDERSAARDSLECQGSYSD
jgi:hypothetical protein